MAERRPFIIDASTVEFDPQILTPVAKDFKGKKYRFWNLASEVIASAMYGGMDKLPSYLSNIRGLRGLKLRLDDVTKYFGPYRDNLLEKGHQLELGVAVEVVNDKIFFPNNDIGIWERIPESRRVTMEDRFRVMDEFNRR